MEGCGVQDYQAFDSLRVTSGPSHADHAPPVVHYERDLAVQLQVVDEPLQVLHAALEAVWIRVVVRLVRESAPDMVGHHDPVAVA